MLYRKILKKAWAVTINNRYLWFFGIFAALLSSSGTYGGTYEMLLGDEARKHSILPSMQKFIESGFFSGQTLDNFSNVFRQDPLASIMLLIIALILIFLFVFLLWLSTVAQAGLVSGAAAHLTGKKSDFSEGLAIGTKKFWPVLGMNIGIKLITALVIAFIGLLVSLAVIKSASYFSFISLLVFIIFMILALAISFIGRYAIAYIVIKNVSFVESFKSGWQLFKTNWLVSLEMGFILFLINIAVGLLVTIFLTILAIPITFLMAVFYKIASDIGFMLIGFMAFILLLVIVIIAGAILSTFHITSWTALFTELVGRGGKSKLNRLFGRE